MKHALIQVLLLLLAPMLCAEEAKIPPQLVGNYMAFFNPSAGGGTQFWTVDIDEQGNYLAFCTSADFDAVRGKLAIAGDKWTLTHDKATIDQGMLESMGTAFTLRGGKGAMMLNKVAPESKQKLLRELNIDPKRAPLRVFLERGTKLAREWRKDAVLVNVRCQPDFDGEIDLTAQGGNLMLFYYCPSRDAGALAMVGAFGDISFTPQKEPVSPWKLPIPKNCISTREAVAAAKATGIKRIQDAELYGRGDDPDLRVYAWVMRHDNGMICVDANLSRLIDYNEFMNGVGRGDQRMPFARGSVSVSRVTVTNADDTYMYYYFNHVVFLDGVDEAITVRVPWRFIPKEEWMPFVTVKNGAMMIPDLSDKLRAGKFTPLTPDQRAILEKGSEALPIGCSPGIVLVENRKKELYPRVKEQLEAYWKRNNRHR